MQKIEKSLLFKKRPVVHALLAYNHFLYISYILLFKNKKGNKKKNRIFKEK